MITRRQAELMGGRLQVESDHGTGSKFILTTRLAPWPPMTVLVVDEVAANRQVPVRLLHDAGCSVDEVRELRDVVERAMARSGGGPLELEHLGLTGPADLVARPDLVEICRCNDGRFVQSHVLRLREINARQRETWRKTIDVCKMHARGDR